MPTRIGAEPASVAHLFVDGSAAPGQFSVYLGMTEEEDEKVPETHRTSIASVLRFPLCQLIGHRTVYSYLLLHR